MSTRELVEEHLVTIAAGEVKLVGDLVIPDAAHGLVLFAHGSGSSRGSPRNRMVAERLHDAGIATLLFDLLTPEEDTVDRVTAHLRFDIDMLARRMIAATDWAHARAHLAALPIGYFGASTGAAAALIAAASRPALVHAVVSRGGRVDLADASLGHVEAPSLFIVGEADPTVLALNREAIARMHCTRELQIVADATHLFEEPGALDEVARLAAAWFARHLRGRPYIVEDTG